MYKKSSKIKVLEETYEAFVKMAKTYAAEHHLAESDKKAAYLLSEKLEK